MDTLKHLRAIKTMKNPRTPFWRLFSLYAQNVWRSKVMIKWRSLDSEYWNVFCSHYHWTHLHYTTNYSTVCVPLCTFSWIHPSSSTTNHCCFEWHSSFSIQRVLQVWLLNGKAIMCKVKFTDKQGQGFSILSKNTFTHYLSLSLFFFLTKF